MLFFLLFYFLSFCYVKSCYHLFSLCSLYIIFQRAGVRLVCIDSALYTAVGCFYCFLSFLVVLKIACFQKMFFAHTLWSVWRGVPIFATRRCEGNRLFKKSWRVPRIFRASLRADAISKKSVFILFPFLFIVQNTMHYFSLSKEPARKNTRARAGSLKSLYFIIILLSFIIAFLGGAKAGAWALRKTAPAFMECFQCVLSQIIFLIASP